MKILIWNDISCLSTFSHHRWILTLCYTLKILIWNYSFLPFSDPNFCSVQKVEGFQCMEENVRTKRLKDSTKSLNENLFIVNPVSRSWWHRKVRPAVRSFSPRNKVAWCEFVCHWSLQGKILHIRPYNQLIRPDDF